MNVIDEIKANARGVMLLKDWLGDGGKPVSQLQADRRAKVCVFGNQSQPCVMNAEPNWWDRIKSLIADTIKGQLELKHKMNLKTPHDDALNMCRCCGCCLRTKVWTPIEHIKAHYDFDRMQKAPPWCWQKTELESTK